MEYAKIGVPQFNGHSGMKYEIWKTKMKIFLHAHGYDVRKLVVTGYNASKKPKTVAKKELKKEQKNSNGFHPGRIM
jgi:hypothetical protein